MNQHEQINRDIDDIIESEKDAEIILPGAIATLLLKRYAEELVPPARLPVQIEYASLEHLKQMARARLRHRFDAAESDDADAYQGSLFVGILQDRYPLPRERGDEAAYKRRSRLTPDERAWNVAMLRKSAEARLEHADALELEGKEAA